MKLSAIITTIAISLVLMAAPAYAETENSNAIVKTQDKEKAPTLEQKAEAGDVESQIELGLMYEGGSSDIPQDRDKANEWFHKAEKQGSFFAKFLLITNYRYIGTFTNLFVVILFLPFTLILMQREGIKKKFPAYLLWTANAGLRKYIVFKGRACRSESWSFSLFLWLAGAAACFIDEAILNGSTLLDNIIVWGGILPNITMNTRRLHDIGRSGWWQLIIFIPVIGSLILLYWDFKKGDLGENRFGPDPLQKA